MRKILSLDAVEQIEPSNRIKNTIKWSIPKFKFGKNYLMLTSGSVKRMRIGIIGAIRCNKYGAFCRGIYYRIPAL